MEVYGLINYSSFLDKVFLCFVLYFWFVCSWVVVSAYYVWNNKKSACKKQTKKLLKCTAVPPNTTLAGKYFQRVCQLVVLKTRRVKAKITQQQSPVSLLLTMEFCAYSINHSLLKGLAPNCEEHTRSLKYAHVMHRFLRSLLVVNTEPRN